MKPARLLLLILAPGLFAQAKPAATPSAATSQPAASSAKSPNDYYALSPEQFFKRTEVQKRYSRGLVNIALAEAAVFQETNNERAGHDLPAFAPSFALTLMAQRHSEEMVRLHYFAHQSPTPANRMIVDRLRNVGLVNVTAGENIAVLPAKEIGSGHYLIHYNGDGSESWTDAQTGAPVLFDTYEELAQAVVKEWMDSATHRANILDKRFIYLGVGAARGAYGDKSQDSFYMTQDFSAAIVPAAEVKAQKELNGQGQTAAVAHKDSHP